MKLKKLFLACFCAVTLIPVPACGGHTHEYADGFSFDDTYHWKNATCCENAIGEKEMHDYANGTCTVCQCDIADAAFKYEAFGVGVNKTLTLEFANSAFIKNVTYSTTSSLIALDSDSGEVSGVALGCAEVLANVTYVDDTTSTTTCKVEVNNGALETTSLESNFVKWVGRNFVYNQSVNCFNTTSGFETIFYGTELTAKLTSGGSQTPRICVLVDENTSPSEKIIDLSKNNEKQDVVLASGLTEGYHTVKVYKITEAAHNSLSVNSLQTDGYFHAKPATKNLKIEVYGDSISTGYKNLKPLFEHDDNVINEGNQNGCLTYAWLTAQNLNAEINVMAHAGIGLNYSQGFDYLMRDAWDDTYCSAKDFLGYGNVNPTWDFNNYTADIAIVNIGTNDYYINSSSMSGAYRDSLVQLCKDLLKKHGNDLKIVFVYGLMTSGNAEVLEDIASRQDNVYAIELDKSNQGHPTASEHASAATALTQFIKGIL